MARPTLPLCGFLSELLDCRKSQIQIIDGEKGRIKTIEIAGIDAPEVWRRLGLHRDDATVLPEKPQPLRLRPGLREKPVQQTHFARRSFFDFC
jgi:hypothetical protein